MSITSTLAPNTTPAHPASRKQAAYSAKKQHLMSRLPSLLNNEHILAQLAQGGSDVGTLNMYVFHDI